jgi:hypothetical protein
VKSARQIRYETAQKMGTAPPPPSDDGREVPPELRCSTPNCRNRWTEDFARGRRCSPCADRMRSAAGTRQLFTRPPSLEGSTPVGEPVDEDQLPF